MLSDTIDVSAELVLENNAAEFLGGALFTVDEVSAD
jgi:hypothetical protein